MSDIPEDVKRQALEAVSSAKIETKLNALPVQNASLPDVERGPTTLPGTIPGYGRNINPVEPMPEPHQTIEPER